jgi:predicted ferric reductase
VNDEALWAVGRGTGIVALVFLTTALAFGIAARSGRRVLGLPRFAVAEVHRFAALFATLLVALHIGLLFADPYAQLRFADLVVPFLGSYRPLWQGLGTLALEVLVVVVLTGLLRNHIAVPVFRVVHWASYALWPIAAAHALGDGTDAGHPWFLVIAGCCALTVGAVLVWRLRADYTEFATTRTSVRT